MVLENVSFVSEKKADGTLERVPTILLRPENVKGRLPAVIVLHGTGGTKESQLAFMKELVKRNIIGIAIDARYHGERAKGGISYQQAITNAWLTKTGAPMEHPFYYDTVWDLWRLVDYLETRDDIDAKRLGMIGFSMGGIQTYLAAAVDERILVSVPAIAVQSFRWSLENDKWQGRANTIKQAHLQAAKDLGEPAVNQKVCRTLWSKIVPGITEDYDCPSMLRLFAGRPLLILSGTKDGNCPYGGATLAIASVEQAYKDAGKADRLRVMVEEVGHTVTATQKAAALDWFAKWLK
jgi:dienelactone hydrolase